MSDSLFAVQDAVFDKLAADAGMQALIGAPTRLYDHVLPGATFPFVTLGEARAETFDLKDRTGMSQVIIIHAWSRYRGRKEVKDILQATYNALHRASLTVSGHDFVECRFESADMLIDDDALTYHGLARYRIITQASS